MGSTKRFFALICFVVGIMLTGCATDPNIAAYEYTTVMLIVAPNTTIQSPKLARLQNQGWEIYKCNVTYTLNNYHYYYSLRRPKAQVQPLPETAKPTP